MATETKIKIGVDFDDKPLKSLKAELREVVQQMYNFDAGSAEFEKLNQRAAEMRDKMAEVNEQIAVFATGSKYEQVGNSFGEISAGIQGLDFDRAVQGAKLFQQTAGNITFKDAIGSLKQLGSTFMSIGKTILTNPLFLIVAVVGAIIAAIVKLLDELGILQDIFNAVGEAIGWVIQKLKDLLDWMGLTSYAAEDAARKQADAQAKIAESYKEKQETITDSYDHEIKLAGIAGKNTVEMERQKQYAIIETQRAQYNALKAQMEALRLAGDLTKEKADELRKSMLELKKGIREARQEVQVINAQEIADERKANETKQADAKASAKARADRQKQYNADRLVAQRLVQDAEIQLMKEGVEKDLKENQVKYQRLIEDTKSNERLLATEKATLIKQFQEQQFLSETAITDKIRLDEEAKQKEQDVLRLQAQKAFQDQLFALREESNQKAIDAFTLSQQEETDALKKQLDENLISLEQYNQGKKAIEEFYSSEIGKIRQSEADAELERQELIKNTSLDLASQVLNGISANLKQGGAAAKAIAVAQATIDTYRAAVASFASTAANPVSILFPAAPFLAAGAAVAMGIANVRKILAVNPSTSGGGGSTPTASTAQAPSFGSAQPQQTPTMNLNNGQSQSASYQTKERVIVVDYNDITDKGKELDRSREMVTLA